MAAEEERRRLKKERKERRRLKKEEREQIMKNSMALKVEGANEEMTVNEALVGVGAIEEEKKRRRRDNLIEVEATIEHGER